MSFLPMIGGALISGLFASKAAKKQKQSADELLKLAQPGLKAREAALGYYLPKLGKGSKLLTALYKRSVTETQKAGQSGIGRARSYWGRMGNIGRARGEEERIRQQTQETQNQAALTYAGQQEQYKSATAQALAGIGEGSLNLAASAISGKAEATQGMYQDFAGILGDLTGYWMNKDLLAKENMRMPLPPLPEANSGLYTRSLDYRGHTGGR